MVKPYIAMASLMGGALFAGLALYIQVDPTLLTSPSPAAAPQEEAVVPAARSQSIDIPTELPVEGDAIEIEPVEIYAPPPALRGAPQSKPPAEPEQPNFATKPCSEWRELGPKASETMPNAMHRVRQLCVS